MRRRSDYCLLEEWDQRGLILPLAKSALPAVDHQGETSVTLAFGRCKRESTALGGLDEGVHNPQYAGNRVGSNMDIDVTTPELTRPYESGADRVRLF